MKEKTFIKKCIEGEEHPENLIKYIKKYEKSNTKKDLYTYLGFKNPAEGFKYTENVKLLLSYLNKIKNGIEIPKEIPNKKYDDKYVNHNVFQGYDVVELTPQDIFGILFGGNSIEDVFDKNKKEENNFFKTYDGNNVNDLEKFLSVIKDDEKYIKNQIEGVNNSKKELLDLLKELKEKEIELIERIKKLKDKS